MSKHRWNNIRIALHLTRNYSEETQTDSELKEDEITPRYSHIHGCDDTLPSRTRPILEMLCHRCKLVSIPSRDIFLMSLPSKHITALTLV